MASMHDASSDPEAPSAIDSPATYGRKDEGSPLCPVALSIPLSFVGQDGGETRTLANILPLNGGQIFFAQEKLSLTTDRRQWAYSAEVQFDFGARQRSYTIVVKLSVSEGELGVGWISADRSRWIARASASAGDGRASLLLAIPQEETDGHLLFENWAPRSKPSLATLEGIVVVEHAPAALSASEAYERGKTSERSGQLQEAILLYAEALRQNPAHILARAGLGALRLKKPPRPFLDEVQKRIRVDSAEFMIEVRNPCNYRCFYCVAAGHNNEPVQRFDLAAIERAYSQIIQRCIVTELECGGGEPTVHPQFPDLIRLTSKFGAVSFPTNNSQNPERWLPKSTAHRLLIRSTLHPESEENLNRYLRNARYLIESGCDFQSTFVCHPLRLDKVTRYRALFLEEGITFLPVPFIGKHQEKLYPHAYTDEEKRMIGIDQTSQHWLQQIQPHVNRIRNFRGIPCIAGYRSIYITARGTLRRCTYDLERVLDRPLSGPEPCGVSNCGCGMLLDRLNTVDLSSLSILWAKKNDLPELDLSWMTPLAQEFGYLGPDEAIAIEMKAMYDALMDAFGKDEFPED